MTSETRKTLEALADAAATVADVLAREDPKRMAVPEAVRDQWVAADRTEAAAIHSALAEIDALRAQVADLEARAIPKAWVARFPAYEINAWGSDDREKARVRVVGAASPVLTTWESDLPNDSVHPTLSDALAAAAKEPL